MKFGVIVPVYHHLAQAHTIRNLILKAEELGYDSVWFGDHVVIPDFAVPVHGNVWYEVLTTMTFGAGLTRRLKFGSDVMVVPYRQPVLLAKMLSTLDALSGGRLILGVGVGAMRREFEVLGAPYLDRGPATDEYLRAIKALWTQETPTFEGRFVQFSGIRFGPKPVQQPHPPIWVGGNTRRAMRRAAELGNGWHPLWPTLDDYSDAMSYIRRLLKGQPNEETFTFSYSCPQMSLIGGRPATSGPALERPGPEAEQQVRRHFGSYPHPPRAEGGRPMFSGAADEVAGDIQRFIDLGVQYMVARFPAHSAENDEAEYMRNMEVFAREVMPQVQG